MAIYVVGDVQGCAKPLAQLLSSTDFNADADRIWLAGDLVNRGPQSMEVLAFARTSTHCQIVLGNHDLHLLAVAHGVRKPGKQDTLAALLADPSAGTYLDWLRQQPLVHYEAGHLLVHAGVLPCWTRQQTLDLAAEVEAQLRGPNFVDFLTQMYGDEPAQWDNKLTGAARWRVVVNALTRLRFCTPDGVMALHSSESANHPPTGCVPWFDTPNRSTADTTVVFGHWSTLGLTLRPNLIGLDTGCVWGGKLTAVKLATDWTQRQIYQVACAQAQQPGSAARQT